MTDDQIDYTLGEISRDLAACEKLKSAPWSAVPAGRFGHWHDDPRSHTTNLVAYEGRTEYTIAIYTIHDTQREAAFAAAMRDEYPDALKRERAMLIYIRELRKKVARKKARR
jgi:hypothetical protein